MAYANLGREEAAAAMHISPSTLDRVIGKRSGTPRGADWDQLMALADAAGVPFAWFWADFDRLDEIAPADRAPALFNAGKRDALADAVAASAGLRRGRGSGST